MLQEKDSSRPTLITAASSTQTSSHYKAPPAWCQRAAWLLQSHAASTPEGCAGCHSLLLGNIKLTRLTCQYLIGQSATITRQRLSQQTRMTFESHAKPLNH